VRIGLFSDCEGNVAALEAVLGALRGYAPDVTVCAGDILSSPFSPDPPGETVALLRASDVLAVVGNNDRYLIDWGTHRWPHTLWMRLRRSDPLGAWIDQVSAGQALLSSADLEWLRGLPEEVQLDDGRVYVCHGMPGNCWNSIWPRSPLYDANVSDMDRAASLRMLGNAELALCGHVPEPWEYRDQLPDGRELRVVRAGPRSDSQVGFAVITRRQQAWDVEWGAASLRGGT